MFSAGFLEVLVYGSLGWCALSALGLLTMLVRDLTKGATW
jgi:hypothetical protein|tara:strand:+ start:127 stop:246 length:120 start_codon:yes stop_codon:yes gene_type:complete